MISSNHIHISLSKGLILGVLVEVLIFVGCYFYFEEMGEVFRHAARYSGRVSWVLYLFIFYYFTATYHRQSGETLLYLRNMSILFCVMHFIHLGFLATNVYLNDIQLVPYKLVGGSLGYLLILIYPLFLHKLQSNVPRLLYFYYLGIIIAMTYVARIKGDFEGASPSAIHYIGLGSVLLAFVVFSGIIFFKRR